MDEKPIVEYNWHTKTWLRLDMNFPLSDRLRERLADVRGVECVERYGRYFIEVHLGLVFHPDTVLHNIRVAIFVSFVDGYDGTRPAPPMDEVFTFQPRMEEPPRRSFP